MTAVCIAGMHRSGTSLVARLLKECGVFLGAEEELLPAAPENRDGFYEHAALTRLNDEILATLGGSWDNPPPSPDGWETKPELETLEERAGELVAPLRAHAPWGWKDPRNSLTLPLWRRVLGDEVFVVVCLRHPAEVVSSLLARNELTLHRASELCLVYMRALAAALPGTRHVVVPYESLLEDPGGELRRLLDVLALSPTPLELARAVESVNQGLRHHVAGSRSAANDLPKEVLAPYDELRAEAAHGHGPAGELDLQTQLEAARSVLRETRDRVYGLQDKLRGAEARMEELHEQARETARAHREDIRALKAELESCAGHVNELAQELRWIKETRVWRSATAWWSLKDRLRGRRDAVG